PVERDGRQRGDRPHEHGAEARACEGRRASADDAQRHRGRGRGVARGHRSTERHTGERGLPPPPRSRARPASPRGGNQQLNAGNIRGRSGFDSDPNPEEWIPDAKNQTGDWRSHRAESPWQAYASLQAPDGVIAVAGQALTLSLNGLPLEDVSVEIEDSPATAKTDKTGRCLLSPHPEGHKV